MARFLITIGLIFASAVFFGAEADAVTLYSTGNDGTSLYTINSTTGASSLIGNFGYSGTYSVAFNAQNVLYAVVDSYNTSALATVNLTTGAATKVGAGTNIPELMAIVFGPNGTLYGASWGTNDLYTINPTTGVATAVGNLGFGGVMDLAFNAAGQLFAISNALYQINLGTGAGTLVTNLSDTDLMGLTIDPSGNFLATEYSGAGYLDSINTSTGAVTVIGATNTNDPMGLTYEHQSVPEPQSLMLFGGALAALGFIRRRDRAWAR